MFSVSLTLLYVTYRVLSPVVVAQVDPRIPLPQRFINFVIKNLAGVFLSLFQRQVVKVSDLEVCEGARS